MSYVFPSEEWVAALKEQINASEEYQQSAADWEAGDVCFRVQANPDIGLSEDGYIWLDLYHGQCRDAQLVDAEKGESARFVITATYDRWKQLITGQLDPVTAMMMGQMKVKGNLGELIRYTRAAKELIACAGRVPTQFLGGEG